MACINIFISHSSADKALVRAVVEMLGNNGITVDEYVFESGERTEDEINISIENSGIFCLLISESSMGKDWVLKEIAKYKSIIDSGKKMKFLPLIIDENIDYSYEKIPIWIKNEYNLRDKFTNPVFLARKLEEELNKLRWDEFPKVRERELIFAGRDYDMARIREKYASSNFKRRRAVIVSGIPDGIGRRRFIVEFIKILDRNKKDTYQPISIALDRGNSIEDFIIQLNSLVLLKDNEELIEYVSTRTKAEKILLCNTLLMILFEHKENLLIRDNGAIILNDGSICDWFEEILVSVKINRTFFYVVSRYRFIEEDSYPEIVSYSLNPLSDKNAKVLFNELLQKEELELSNEDITFFLEKTANMPQLIFNCVNVIAEIGPVLAKQKQKKYEFKGDELIKSFVDDYKDKPEHLQMLILLSEVDFLTYSQIRKICRGIISNTDEILMDLYSLSIYEHFGTNGEFIRMNSVISDLMKRSRYKLNPEIWSNLQVRVNEIIEQQEFATADLGILSKKIENEIKGDIRNIKRNHIVPSIALKIILDEYSKRNKRGYENVILICTKVLENKQNIYVDIINRIGYYLCASYAHLGDEMLFQYWDCLDNYDKKFLHGIYYRRLKNYKSAEKKFREAMNLNPNNNSVKNELAISLQRQGKYSLALTLAKEAYDTHPTNPFYIVTYFKSLVRDPKTDDEVLNDLIQQLKSAWDINRRTLSQMLEAEYEFFRNNDFVGALSMYRNALATNPFYPVFISASEICEISGHHEEIEKLSKEFGFN